IDMDAFFASIEQACNPRLKGKPLIVGGREDNQRTVVCASSYEAKRLGINSGMSCHEAFRICPYAEFVPADSAKYLYVSNRIFEILKEYSPQVEQASVDEFYLEVTGEDRRFGSYELLAREIKSRIKQSLGITGSIGISINRLMSKVASKLKKPDGFVHLERKQISKVLAVLPVEKIPGIGKKLAQRLEDIGVYLFSDLEQQSQDFLCKQFGKVGLWMYSVANPNEDAQDISWYCQEPARPKSVGHSYTLPHDIYSRTEVDAWIRLLCEMVGTRLRRLDLDATTVHIYVRKPDMAFIGKEKNFKDSTHDSEVLFRRALFILNSIYPTRSAIRAIGIIARNLTQPSMGNLFLFQQKREQVVRAQDDINNRFGDWTIYPAQILNRNYKS
ncbi:MAG: DNA polymerase IV, partial [Thermodesulfovibrionia bacterium]|nr:DNA polymerase IV [Thermodesulfovibrionia bacterium]